MGADVRTANDSAQEYGARRDDGGFARFLFVATVAGILALAWVRRDSHVINPERDLGYALGIIGSLLMLGLALYPMRKRLKSMRNWGRVADWFRWHMILGIAGPAMVVLHSNYKVQSTNAAVALTAMLIVAGSGIVGRYLYGRIHKGLYGSKLEARELMREAAAARGELSVDFEETDWRQELAAFERAALTPTTSLFAAIGRSLALRGLKARARRQILEGLRRDLDRQASLNRWRADEKRSHAADAVARLDRYFAAASKVSDLAVFDRFFAAWHVLHLPLFILLIVTAVIHVIAVHLY